MQDSSGLKAMRNRPSAWAVGGRVGYVVSPNLLRLLEWRLHAVALRSGRTCKWRGIGPVVAFTSPSHTYNGWFVGGGTEYALNFSWLPISGLFWRNEYRFSSFSKADLPIRHCGWRGVSALGVALGNPTSRRC